MTAPQCPLCRLTAMLPEAELPRAGAGKKRKPRKSRGGKDDAAAAWEAVGAAIALLTARRGCSGISRAEILGDVAPERAIVALELLADGLLKALAPGEAGTGVLKDVGLLALREAAR